VTTLEGEVAVDVPHGSQHGDRITIPGAGVPKLKGVGRGDLYVELSIQVPKKLNKEQKEILQKFAATMGEGQAGSGFFQKIFE